MEYIGLVCFILAGISEGVMDTLQFHYHRSIFIKFNRYFWNPQVSWKNKYKNNDPLQGPKFPLSTTLFVGLTDAWHLFKLVRNTFIFLGIVFLAVPANSVLFCILWIVLARVLFGLSFTISYKEFG